VSWRPGLSHSICPLDWIVPTPLHMSQSYSLVWQCLGMVPLGGT
jgi:hypothetical protein